jgi:hypothetical protein
MRTKALSVIIFLVFVFVITSVTSAQIATGQWGLHVYYVFSYPNQLWDAAASDLASRLPGYYLATITSQEEQNYLYSMMTTYNISGQYWLGGYQYPLDEPVADANWTWVTGEPWSYTNWLSPPEPNDAFGPGSEQYLAMWKNNLYDWQWNDDGNVLGLGNISGYVAETVIPEPGTILLLGSGFLGLGIVGWLRRRKA